MQWHTLVVAMAHSSMVTVSDASIWAVTFSMLSWRAWSSPVSIIPECKRLKSHIGMKEHKISWYMKTIFFKSIETFRFNQISRRKRSSISISNHSIHNQTSQICDLTIQVFYDLNTWWNRFSSKQITLIYDHWLCITFRNTF